jgi:DNA-binding XRE family transcriptional regulator
MANELNITWGQKLREVRTQREISVLELSRSAEVSPNYIYMLENGKNGASDELRMKLAKALDVQVEDIWSYPVAS